jgi:predicted GIY-YIG superfamily endonuclease
MRQSTTGTVYLIHFERRLKHAGHYLGYCRSLDERLNQHRTGNGARLLEVIGQVGIGWRVVRTWTGDRGLERRLKNQKNTPRKLCPVCRGEVAYDALPPAGAVEAQPVDEAEGDPPF